MGIFDIVLGSACVACGSLARPPLGAYGLCRKCASDLPWLPSAVCGKCGRPLVPGIGLCLRCREANLYFDACRAIWIHTGPAKALIKSFKYGRDMRHLGLFGISLARAIPQLNRRATVVPVPADPRRRLRRGWDPVTSICESIPDARVERILVKTHGREQKHMGLQERLVNPGGRFSVKEGARLPIACVLIDDVVTTGATLSECARVLKSEGTAWVGALALAMEI
jgi:competence protein ComFC